MLILGTVASGVDLWTPAKLSNLKAWYDASDTSTITASSNSVSQWNDKSGNAYHVSQATASYQPQTGSTFNGLNVINFDGGDGLFNTTKSNWSFLFDGTKVLMGAVIKPPADGTDSFYCLFANNESGPSAGVFVVWDDRTFLGQPRNNMFWWQQGTGSDFGAVLNFANGALPANAFDWVTMLSDPTNSTVTSRSSIKTDLVTNANDNDPRPNGSGDPQRHFCIGSWPTTTTGTVPTATYGWNGSIAEIVIAVGADATSTNETNLKNYLKNKWGV